MKININKGVLLDAIRAVAGSSTPHGAALLANIRITGQGDSVEITATDTTKQVKIRIAGEVILPGGVVVNCRTAAWFVGALPDGMIELSVNKKGNVIKFKSGKTEFSASAIAPSDFVELPFDPANATTYEIPASTMLDMLRKSAYAASTEQHRRGLMALHHEIEGGVLTSVATDGCRIALAHADCEIKAGAGEMKYDIPREAVSELRKLLSRHTVDPKAMLRVCAKRDKIAIDSGNWVFFSTLADIVYPQYKQVIPTKLKDRVEANREMLIEALARALVSAGDLKAVHVVVDSKSGIMKLESGTDNTCETEIPIKCNCRDLDFSINATYLIASLESFDDETAHLRFAPDARLIGVEGNGRFGAYIMPLRNK